jgi:glycolate oxidase
LDSKLIDSLKDIVGKRFVTTELIDLIAHSTDAGENRARPEVLVYPHSTEEVSAIMKLADAELIPVTPRGAGTNTSGEVLPLKGGIVLDMSLMDKILDISLQDRVAVVQPGVVYGSLNKELEPHGFHFPPDPASGKVATLGGNISTNAGGLKGAKYGVTKDYVLGLEVVLPNGEVLRTGGRYLKCSSGFNLTQLFVGSEGALGVITEAILKINPKPTHSQTAMATFDKLVDAGKAVGQIMSSGAIPSVLELLDKNLIWAINEDTGMGLPSVEALLLTETDGFTYEDTEFQMAKIIKCFEANNASSVRKAKDKAEAEALWTARRSAYPVITRLNNGTYSGDTTVPLSKVPEMLEFIEELGKKHDMLVPSLGHVGDGNLHPHLCFDRGNSEEMAKLEMVKDELYTKAVELGGTISGEHGVGLTKAKYMEMEHGKEGMAAMRNLKKLFDPKGIMNPGKQDLEAGDA